MRLPPLPPPWMLLGMIVGWSDSMAKWREVGYNVFATVTGRGGQCGLCDNIVNSLLHFDDGSKLQCQAICLWRFKKCIATCEKIVKALSESSKYPCVATGMCPEVDEFGEKNQCAYSWKHKECQPQAMCDMRLAFPRPRCQLKAGYLQYHRYTTMLSRHTGALASAIRDLPRCGEAGAHPVICVSEPTGLGMASMIITYILLSMVAVVQSIRAIETPGGEDDRQWLCFWIIMFGFFTLERFADVLLSWAPRYYEAKLALILWLMYGRGADLAYRRVHRVFRRIQKWMSPVNRDCDDEDCENARSLSDAIAEDTYITELSTIVALGPFTDVAREVGSVAEALKGCAGPSDVAERYGEGVPGELQNYWDRLEPRYVEVTLERGRGLTAPDGTTNAYVAFYLVQPSAKVMADLACRGAGAGKRGRGSGSSPLVGDGGVRSHVRNIGSFGSSTWFDGASPICIRKALRKLATSPRGAHEEDFGNETGITSPPKYRHSSPDRISSPNHQQQSSASIAAAAVALLYNTPPASPHADTPTNAARMFDEPTDDPVSARTEMIVAGDPSLVNAQDNNSKVNCENNTIRETSPGKPPRSPTHLPKSTLISNSFTQDGGENLSNNSSHLSIETVSTTASTASSIATATGGVSVKAMAVNLPPPLHPRRTSRSPSSPPQAHPTRRPASDGAILGIEGARAGDRSRSQSPSAVGRGEMIAAPASPNTLMSPPSGEMVVLYSRTKSRVKRGTVAPVWDQELELYLEGGYTNVRGDYKNPSAPWTMVLGEVWDWDSLRPDHYLGEFTVPLTLLMDGRPHQAWYELQDPRGKLPAGATGEVLVTLQIV